MLLVTDVEGRNVYWKGKTR